MSKNEHSMKVLDHGYVQLRNLAGPTRRPDQEFDASDLDPPNAARMSFDQTDSEVIFLKDGTSRPRTSADDLRLARYLMQNWHTSPFEMVQSWWQVKMPIFVARQLIRHRTASVNEISGRYVQLPAEWYIPELAQVEARAEDKKQGGRFVDLSDPNQLAFAERRQACLRDSCERSYLEYVEAIQDGAAMEQARMHLHLNHYTEWLWSQNLHNLMHLLGLRLHGHAQWETRQYAEAKYQLLKTRLPYSMELFDEYRKRG